MSDFIEHKTEDLYREHEIHLHEKYYESSCSTCFSNRPIACGHGTIYPLTCAICKSKVEDDEGVEIYDDLHEQGIL